MGLAGVFKLQNPIKRTTIHLFICLDNLRQRTLIAMIMASMITSDELVHYRRDPCMHPPTASYNVVAIMLMIYDSLSRIV
jgi:hypothetical protein